MWEQYWINQIGQRWETPVRSSPGVMVLNRVYILEKVHGTWVMVLGGGRIFKGRRRGLMERDSLCQLQQPLEGGCGTPVCSCSEMWSLVLLSPPDQLSWGPYWTKQCKHHVLEPPKMRAKQTSSLGKVIVWYFAVIMEADDCTGSQVL